MKLFGGLFKPVSLQDERVQFALYLIAYFLIISLVPTLLKNVGQAKWLLWPLILIAQNFAFTFVSRARSSANLWRHAKASLMSNGIWIVSQIVLLGPMFDYLTGKHGVGFQMLAEMLYTISTMSGSLYAHYHALKTEKGKSAVGANKLYAQVPVAQWEAVKTILLKPPVHGLNEDDTKLVYKQQEAAVLALINGGSK